MEPLYDDVRHIGGTASAVTPDVGCELVSVDSLLGCAIREDGLESLEASDCPSLICRVGESQYA